MTALESRLTAVRELMVGAGYDALVIPRADEYLGEYIPAHNERLQWISGFNGSAGVVVVLADKAAIFVDGRYTVQVRQEVSAQLYEYHHLIDEPHLLWLQQQFGPGARVAYDPRMHSLSWQQEALRVLGKSDVELVAETDNLVDRSWTDRPEPIIESAILLELRYTGEDSQSKRRRIGVAVAALGADAALIFAPDSVSWLLNIRGSDVPCVPIVQSFALLSADGSMVLFVDPGRVPDGLGEHVGQGVEWLPEPRAEEVFLRYRGQCVLADPVAANAWTQLALEASASHARR